MFTGKVKPFRIIGDPDNQRPDKCSSTVPNGVEAIYVCATTLQVP
jgi:hypothetical protein